MGEPTGSVNEPLPGIIVGTVIVTNNTPIETYPYGSRTVHVKKKSKCGPSLTTSAPLFGDK